MKLLKNIAFWICLPFGLIYLLLLSCFIKWDLDIRDEEDYDPYC